MLVLQQHARPGGLGRACCSRIAAPRGAAVFSRPMPSGRAIATRPMSRSRHARLLMAASSGNDGDTPLSLHVAPLEPTSDTGIQLHGLLANPATRTSGSFDTMLCAHLEVIAADLEAEALLMMQKRMPMSPADDALRLRLVELRRNQRVNATSDAMYACAVRQLMLVGVPMAGRGSPEDGREHAAAQLGIHGADASTMVEAYVSAVVDGLTPKAKLDEDVILRVAKAQLAQSYFASMMLGYFLRALAFRFRLDRQLGTLPPEITADAAAEQGNCGTPLQAIMRKLTAGKEEMTTREERTFAMYVERCQAGTGSAAALTDEQSSEVRSLMLRHTGSLFGDCSRLQLEFGEDLLTAQSGGDAAMAAVAARIKADIANQRLESSVVRVARIKYLVREAAAMGALLRDVEAFVRPYGLLL